MTRFARRHRRASGLALLAGVAGLLGGRPALGQDIDPLSKLEPGNKFAIELLIDSAKVADLPSRCLLSKAQEGIAKRADGKLIVSVVHRLLTYLRTAQSALGTHDQEEICAAAAVLEAGGKPGHLNPFRIRQPGRNDLEAFTVWADLMTRGVPSDDASSAIVTLWRDGADDATFHSLWKNVQSDILQGLNPSSALQNRIREAPGRVSPSTVKPPDGQQENQSSR